MTAREHVIVDDALMEAARDLNAWLAARPVGAAISLVETAELTALRAVAEAARKLMDVDCFPDEIGSSLEWQAVEAAIATLDRAREGGGG